MLHRFFIGILAVFYAAVGFAQAPLAGQSQFRHLDIKDGLPNQLVFSIDQDSQGYIWVGTKDGLARFDGARFKVYQHIPGDQQSLPSNSVQSSPILANSSTDSSRIRPLGIAMVMKSLILLPFEYQHRDRPTSSLSIHNHDPDDKYGKLR